ncbi:PepSY domain-containing protein [Thermococcus sp. LS1]|uniref:PepSY domain-containing protein n=1 Tax=Thermococcus sp. LS1 TaxID=1638259 RepID=UPI00143A5B1D|nr:PepSY domain-containing protein [Thermococcus sp. LS1]
MRIWKFSIGLKTAAVIAALIMAVSIGAFAVATSNTTTSSVGSDLQSPGYVGSIKVDQYDNLSEGQEAKALQSLAKITPEQAKSAALSKVNGSVVKVELDNENGYLVYSVEVKTGNGIIKDVKVDAGDGKVLYVDGESGVEEESNKELEKETSKDSSDSDSINEEVEQEDEN